MESTQSSSGEGNPPSRRMARVALVASTLGFAGLVGIATVGVNQRSKSSSAGQPLSHHRRMSPSEPIESNRKLIFDVPAAVKKPVGDKPAPTLRSPSIDLSAAASAAGTTTTTPAAQHKDYPPEALKDEVTSLPGLTDFIPFRHFSGYLPITDSKNIFYWYTEAIDKPDEAPLVFWTNGGPGCSGLFGFMNENGPFRPTKDGDAVALNPYAWNTVANMLFVEQPVTVGFSYTTDEKDKVFGDDQAAADNYLVVQKFLERFPHMRDRDLHLSGESYGGHYLPTLAKYIVDQNAKGENQKLNLKGFAVGNPLTDPVENLVGAIDAFYGHSLIPQDLYEGWNKNCDPENPDSLFSDTCMELQNACWAEISGLNPYALDYPVCTEAGASHSKEGGLHPIAALGRNQRYKLLAHTLTPFLTTQFDQASWSESGKKVVYEPCEDSYAAKYLNRLDVQKAIHAKEGTSWGDCSDEVFYYFNHADRHAYMQPIYKTLTEDYKQLRILIFSGDDDSVCATQGTGWWLQREDWPVKKDWTAWGIDEQVAGYIKSYTNGVTFATVHGAGHEVPAYKPAEALGLFASYLRGDF